MIKKSNNFDPMMDVPKNDEEAEIAIRFEKDELIGNCGVRLYKLNRIQYGLSVLDSYKKALLAIVSPKHTD